MTIEENTRAQRRFDNIKDSAARSLEEDRAQKATVFFAFVTRLPDLDARPERGLIIGRWFGLRNAQALGSERVGGGCRGRVPRLTTMTPVLSFANARRPEGARANAGLIGGS